MVLAEKLQIERVIQKTPVLTSAVGDRRLPLAPF